MLRNLITKLSPKRQVQLMTSFNRAAIIGNTAMTGYMVGHTEMGIAAGLVFSIKKIIHPVKNHSLEETKISLGFVETLSPKSDIAQKIAKLKEDMGIKEQIDTIIIDSDRVPCVVRINKDLHVIGLPEGFIGTDDLTAEQKVAICAHELAHVARKDASNNHSIKSTTRLLNWINIFYGAAFSVTSLNPTPLIAALIGRKTSQIFLSNERKIAEINADAQAGVYTNAADMLNGFRSFVSSKFLLTEALINRNKENAPGFFNLIFTDIGLNKPYNAFKRHLKILTKAEDLAPIQRINFMEAALRKEDPSYQSEPLHAGITIDICKGCADTDTAEDEEDLRRHLGKAFKRNFGHTDFQTNFKESCQPTVPASFIEAMFSQATSPFPASMIEGADIIIVTPSGSVTISADDLSPPSGPQ